MAATTADAAPPDAGIISGVAATANQAGSSIGLAVLASLATTRAAHHAPAAAQFSLASGYDLVFLTAAALAPAIAAVSCLYPAPSNRSTSTMSAHA